MPEDTQKARVRGANKERGSCPMEDGRVTEEDGGRLDGHVPAEVLGASRRPTSSCRVATTGRLTEQRSVGKDNRRER